jgi:hypothetical protein
MKKVILLVISLGIIACSTDPNVNRAKLSGNKYWTDKAYPGKAYDVQVTDAVKVDGGKYRVKAIVDGEERVGLYDPKTENFDEGYYTAAHERGKKIAEQDEEIRYLKNRIEKLEKENYQMKLRLKYVHAGKGDPNVSVDPNTDVAPEDKDADAKKK